MSNTLLIAMQTASATRLVIAALLGIATIVVLIVGAKVHAFLALMFGSLVMALLAGVPLVNSFDSFTKGLGSTVGNVGVLIALGSMIGSLLIQSGGADQIVDTIIGRTKESMLGWALALIAFIMGIPLFFEVGVVLLIPVVMLVARHTRKPAILLGIPALAGLGCLHGFVPPHPGPLIAISALKANLGVTLGLGLLIAIPTVIVAGPLLAPMMARWVPIQARDIFGDEQVKVAEADRPSFGVALTGVLLPVGLMLLNAIFEIGKWKVPGLTKAVTFLGQPIVALLVTVVFGMFALGMRGGRGLKEVGDIIGSSFAPIAGILLIVGAGGGFKQTLVDSGIATVIGKWLAAQPISPLLAAWLVAVFIRIATGSATVATITAAGLVAPLATNLSGTHLALMVLAIGAGSMFFSHVNDAGFWLVKEYFGMTVGQTIKTWSLMCTVIAVMGIILVLLLSLIL